jgi:Mce-associated membrane protein
MTVNEDTLTAVEPDEVAIDDSVDAEEQATDDNPRPPRIRLRMAILGALVAVVVALAAVGAVIGTGIVRTDRQDQERTAALAAARQEVLNIMTINPGSLNADLNRIIAGSTGSFKQEISSQKSPFDNDIKQEKVTSTGSIGSAGIASLTGDKAVATVAATATVKNTQSPKGSDRDYRLQVTLRCVNGQWLASQMEFIP